MTISEALTVASQRYHANQLVEAEQLCRQILQAEPGQAGAHHLLGMIAASRGDLAAGIDYVRRAVRFDPNDSEAHNSLGNMLSAEGKLNEALPCFHEAIRAQPENAAAHNNLGITLHQLGKPEDAVRCYREGLRFRPAIAEIHYHLGLALRDLGRLDEATISLREALRLRPDYVTALAVLVHLLQHMCEWKDLSPLSLRVIEAVVKKGPLPRDSQLAPFTILCLVAPITTARQQLICARRWVEQEGLGAIPPLATPPTAARSKITLGYLSSDFRQHAVAQQIVELFEKHDRSRFSVFGYSYGLNDGSPLRQRIEKAFDRFVDIGNLSFQAAAEQIRADGVDILIDLTGFTANARTRILALRPAPIQVNYFGYPGTMGAPFMDFILVDDFVVPADHQQYFSEKLVHLPGCFVTGDSQRPISPRTPLRQEYGLPPSPKDGFVFCSFNNGYKIAPSMFDTWMKVLKAIPGSVLWLLEGNRFLAGNLRKEAGTRGVAPDRLIFAKWLAPAEHQARFALADLFLDTFPYNAHTTAYDALASGCPVLTLAGETFASRVAGSMLRSLGLPELVTASAATYEAMAVQLAKDPDRLKSLRDRLIANRPASPLFDSTAFARNLEAAYATMWEGRKF